MRRIRKMTAKQKKLFLLTSMMSVFVMAAAVLFAGGNLSLSPFSVRGTGEIENATITWNSSSARSGSGTNFSYLSKTSSGTGIYLYSKGYSEPTGNQIFDGRTHDSITKGIFITSEAGNENSLFTFQKITKVSVTTGSSTKSSSGFVIYAHGLDHDPDVQQTSLYTETPHTYNFNITNGTSLVIYPKNTFEVDIDSVTITYSCTPGGAPSAKSLSSISISGQTTEFSVGDTFSFGGTVTAHYSDSTSLDVTSSSTFSGYNMSSSGSQTVTVSYTEGGLTKTTTYSITVSEAEDELITFSKAKGAASTFVYSNDTYQYAYTSKGSSTYGAIVEKYTADSQDSDALLAMKGTSNYIYFSDGSINTSTKSYTQACFTGGIKTVTMTVKYTASMDYSLFARVYYSSDGTWSDSNRKGYTVTKNYTEFSFDLTAVNAKYIRIALSNAYAVYHFKEINIELK